MQRYYVPPEAIGPARIVISGDDARHIARVMRLGPGETIEVFDGTGRRVRARLDRVTPEAVWATPVETLPEAGEPPAPLVLVQALLKGDKMDWIVAKATELGITAFYPFVAARSVVRPAEERPEAVRRREARWRKIAKEAAEQSGRSRLPALHPILPADGWVEALKAELSGRLAGVRPYFADEALTGAPNLLARLLPNRPAPDLRRPFEAVPSDVANLNAPGSGAPGFLVVVGPEGGWTDAERAALRALGAEPIGLGRRILRAETAAIAAVTLLCLLQEAASGAGAATSDGAPAG